MKSSDTHQPVLVREVLEYLQPNAGQILIDATAGEGGHSEAILERLDPAGKVLAFERDPELAGHLRDKFSDEDRFHLHRRSYREMPEVVEPGTVDGILFDLGLSSFHLERAERGFSYREQNFLDCRFNPDSSHPPASEWLKSQEVHNLARVLQEAGGVRGAGKLAAKILDGSVPRTAEELRLSVEELVPRHRSASVLARVFQALRIQVNDELEHLKSGLQAGLKALAPGGRMVAISYHSGEDRLVKRHFREAARECVCPPELPVCACEEVSLGTVLTTGTVEPATDEVNFNPRSRSAGLRAFEKATVAETASS